MGHSALDRRLRVRLAAIRNGGIGLLLPRYRSPEIDELRPSLDIKQTLRSLNSNGWNGPPPARR
jgi:hypothetical protein